MLILKGSEVISADQRTIRAGTPGKTLMKRAARGLADFLDSLRAGKIVFILGAGNNAGDGICAAGMMEYNTRRKLLCVFPEEKAGDSVKWASKTFRQYIKYSAKISELKQEIKNADYIVDGIFGTGFHGRIRGGIRKIIDAVNDSGVPVIACDVPSGMDSDTGKFSRAVKAAFTVTFGFPKLGLFLEPASDISGSVRAVNIGLICPKRKTAPEMLEPSQFRKKLPPRNAKSHKYTSGHVLVFAGRMKGAARLAALGAIRAGAGLVTVVSGGKTGMPEALQIRPDTDLKKYIREKKVRAVVFGPGLGREMSEEKRRALKAISALPVTKVIDADGIYAAVKYGLSGKMKNCIFTPHSGEAKLLMRSVPPSPESWMAIRRLAAKLNSVVVLKGHRTAVSDGKKVRLNPTGNPVLASGGTGDLLSGMIAGFASGGMKPFDSACAAVYIHGLAADSFFIERGDRGALVRELAGRVPQAVRKIIEKKPV